MQGIRILKIPFTLNVKGMFFLRFPTKQTNPTVPFIKPKKHRHTPREREKGCEKEPQKNDQIQRRNQFAFFLWSVGECGLQSTRSFVSFKREREGTYREEVNGGRKRLRINQFVRLCLLPLGSGLTSWCCKYANKQIRR